MKILIKDVTAFEGNGHANGFEVECNIDNNTYTLYMQLPHCPDSEHSVLDGESMLSYEQFKAVADEVEKLHSPIELSIMEYGIDNYTCDTNDDGSYSVVDLDDSYEAVKFVRSPHADVYGQELYMLEV